MLSILCLRPYLNGLGIIMSDVETLNELFLHIPDYQNIEQFSQTFLFNQVENIAAVIFAYKKDIFQETKFALEFEKFFDNLGIPFFCCLWETLLASATFFAYINEYGENAFIRNFDFIYCHKNRIFVSNISKCDKEGYRIQSTKTVKADAITNGKYSNSQKVFITILKDEPDVNDLTRQKIVQQMVINNLHPKEVIIINNSVHDFTSHAIVFKALQLLGIISYEKDVISTCHSTHYISPLSVILSTPKDKMMENSLISITGHEPILTKKTIICYERFETLSLMSSSECDTSELTTFDAFEIGTSVTLSVCKYFLAIPEVKHEHNFVGSGTIINLDETTFSVEVVKNGKLYSIGYEKVPLMVSFVGENIQIGFDVLPHQQQFHSHIVKDLLQFLIKDASQIQVNPIWGFTVINDNKNEIFLQFNTSQGRKSATPMQLLLYIFEWAIMTTKTHFGNIPLFLVIAARFLDQKLKQNLLLALREVNLGIEIIQIQKYKILEI